MRLLLVRHGETTYNRMGRVQGRLDTPLTAQGIEQARDRAAALDGGFDAVYSSPLTRTYRTARILAPDTRPTPLPALTGIDMGTATGIRKEALHARLDEAAEDGELWHPPHGEHPERFQERVISVMERIADRHDGRVLVVAHRGVIRAYRCHHAGRSFVTAYQRPVPNSGMTAVDPVDSTVA